MRPLILAVIMALLAATVMAQCPPAGVGNWCSGTYLYDGMGNVTNIGADSYVYDELGRLKNGTADVQRSGRLNRQNYEYDLFGNRTNTYRDGGSVDCLGGCELSPPLAVSIYTNHLTNHNAQYDEAGNLTRIDAATYAYDGAGSLARAISTDDRQFLYTADDERLATRNGLSWTWTVRGLDQKVLREFTSAEVNGLPNGNRQWAKDYVWRDGQLLASVAPGGSGNVIEHYHLDHLGTARVVSNTAGVRLGDHAYYPFGAELMVTPHETPEELMKFAGHERDIQGNDPHTLDMMHARYEMATLGRFMSIDPHPAVPETPQSWNRYAYVGNSPMTFEDPNGQERLPLRMYRNPPGGAAGLHGAAHIVKAVLDVAAPVAATIGLAYEVFRGVISPALAMEELEDEVVAVPAAVEADIAALNTEENVVASLYEDITVGRSLPNRLTNVSKAEFAENLEAEGFAKSTTRDPNIVNFSKGDMKFTLRDTSKSTGGPSVDVFRNGELIQKIRLDPTKLRPAGPCAPTIPECR